MKQRRALWVLLSLVLLGIAGGPPSAALALEEADRLWIVADGAFQDRLYPLSRRMLERLIDRYPTDRRVPDATLLLGKARFSQGQYEAALQAFRQAQSLSPPAGKPDEARFWEAESLFRLKRFVEARGIYDSILADNPSSLMAPDAVYGLAWANLELKRREQAASEFRRLISTYPDNPNVPSATFYLARTLIDLKKPDEATGLLRGFIAKYPDSRLLPDARYLLGRALIAGGQTDEGVAELRAFVKAYPGHELGPQARRTLVDAFSRAGKKGDLVEEYKALIAQSPATAESLYDAGAIAKQIGRPRDAEAAWARLRKEFPQHPLAARVSLDLAQAAFDRKGFQDASVLARAATKSSEEAVRGEALVLLGESELKQRRYASALTAFRAAADTPGLDAALRYRALAGSGLVHEEQRQWPQAAKYYEEVAAKSPDKTLQAWAKQRLAAIGPSLSPAPKGSTGSGAPKNGPSGAKESKP